MKKLIMILAIGLIAGCATDTDSKNSSKNKSTTPNSTESLSPQVITSPTDQPMITPTDKPFTPNPNQTNTGADATGKVWHFACADGCAGGVGDKKAPCPVCGKEMAHNQAYHANDQPKANVDPNSPVINPAATPEPAQNAKGVWHYTCPKGCAGGAAAAGPCAVCGTTLAHNAAYHQ